MISLLVPEICTSCFVSTFSVGSQALTVYLPGRNLLLLSKAGVFCAQGGLGAFR